ncbi:MAG: 3-oxoacyl-[acyl-carrier-protein] reductase [Deltaproteobacteria bacterium]|nr:3-oxoacyl-[acyl-carrier-protein] reductase [Deltaproteobacteria bacterium]
MIMNDASARTVVITGGSKGIGRSVAYRFAEENAKIVLIHFDPSDDACNETLEHLKAEGVMAEGYKADVSSFKETEQLFRDILEKHEKIDVLINNAGITRDTLLLRMSEEIWDDVLRVNLKSVFNCTKAVIRAMSQQRSGAIVSISSVVGQIGNFGQSNYAASKAGIMGFTKSIAREVAGRGINVNAVAPGFIDTEMTEVIPEKAKESFLKQIPFGKMGKPEDVAEAVYWLCSDAAGYITGQVIHVNGGLYM